jgi:hypothetical protein
MNMQAGLLNVMVLGYKNERGHVQKSNGFEDRPAPLCFAARKPCKTMSESLSSILFWNKDDFFLNFMQYIFKRIKKIANYNLYAL